MNVIRTADQRDRLSLGINNGNGISICRAGQDSHKVPAIFPIHFGNAGETYGSVTARTGPDIFLFGEGGRTTFTRNDLQAEMMNCRHVVRRGVAVKLHFEVFGATLANQEHLLANQIQLFEARIGFVFLDDWQTQFGDLHAKLLSDTSPCFELPFIKGE